MKVQAAPSQDARARGDRRSSRTRQIIDAQGREWRVYERTASDHSPMTGRPSLVFDTEGIVRRLWRYPAEWASLSDADLLGLMDTIGIGAASEMVNARRMTT